MSKYEEVKQSESEITVEELQHQKAPRWRSWRVTVLLGALTAIVVLLLNAGVLLWALRWKDVTDGVATVYSGDCEVSKNINTFGHLAINLLGTLLLSASNNCAQLLSAPSQDDIKTAHQQGRWLDIGVPSLRNLKHIPRWRTFLWAVLMLSSFPLHLLYNSVLFTTLSRQQSVITFVTAEFEKGGRWSQIHKAREDEFPGIAWNRVEISHLINTLQQDALDGKLHRLNNEECLENYLTTSWTHIQTYRNALVVTSANWSERVYPHLFHGPYFSGSWWKFPGLDENSIEGHFLDLSNTSYIIAHAASWTPSYRTYARTPALYCLAETYSPPSACTALLDVRFLAIVIGCNALKLLAILAALFGNLRRPLATLGDAISFFLSDSDVSTQTQGPLRETDVRETSYRNGTKCSGRIYHKERLWWSHAPNQSRFGRLKFFIAVAAVLWFIAFGLMAFAIYRSHREGDLTSQVLDFASLGPSSVAEALLISPTVSAPLAANALLPNVPQVFVSFFCLLYNSTLTSMLLAREASAYASNRKSLRVTDPVGSQRSTYWLQMPYRYSLPSIATMALLHWLISRSIFLVRINSYTWSGDLDPDWSTSACGYSWFATMLVVLVGAVLILTLAGMSRRKLDPGMPLIGSCSLAISAACAAAREQEPGAEALPLQYGVLLSKPCDAKGRRYVGFSSKEVAPLEDGVEYR